MASKHLTVILVPLFTVVSGVRAAELAVNSMDMPPDSTVTLGVSGDIASESTFGVVILVELVTRGGNTGTLQFTAEPPVDIVQLGDPWPGVGTFTPFDTGSTGSFLLNGSVDDNGTFIPGPVTFSGDLSGFPVIASVDADGIWDVVLSTSVGDSSWEDLTTTLVAGAITVTPDACILDIDCDDELFCNGAETCVSGSCQAGIDPCPGLECDEVNDVCIECGLRGDPCVANSDCCSGRCHKIKRTCK